MRRYFTELLGTFFLVFTIACTALGKAPLAPLAIGAVLIGLIYAGGHVSGAHYNPAVTLAVLVRGKINMTDAACYWIAQFGGGVLGAMAARLVVNAPPGTPLAPSGKAVSPALLAEALFTFAISYVVLNVATSRDHPDNNFYGLAIGFTVTAGAFAVGGISGAVFNPAVALGGSSIGLFAMAKLWIWLLPELLAGILASVVFLALNPGERTTKERSAEQDSDDAQYSAPQAPRHRARPQPRPTGRPTALPNQPGPAYPRAAGNPQYGYPPYGYPGNGNNPQYRYPGNGNNPQYGWDGAVGGDPRRDDWFTG
jgi:aquaporin Z